MTSSDEAIEAIYAASLDPAGWSEAIGRIAAACGAVTGALYVNRDRQAGQESDALASFGHADAAIASYFGYYGLINPYERHLRHFAVGDIVTEAELDRKLRVAGFFETSEYYNDWVRPQHIRSVIGCYIDRSEGGVLCASFYRPADADDYAPDEVDRFARLMRHATRAVDVGVRLRTADAEMALALERGGGGAVITLGRDGRVRHRNAAAQALLAAGCGLVEKGDRLAAAVVQDQPALDRLIACAFDPKLFGWAESARLAVRRMDGGPPLTARIAASHGLLGAFAPDRVAAAILTVEGFEAEGDRLAERLRRRFALTPAQTRLALALRGGRTLHEAARELGIGHETARTHLKAIFARTDTRRQAELVGFLRDLQDQ